MSVDPWIEAVAQFSAMGLMLWWLTAKLVPQLQHERREALEFFRVEMEKERQLHKEVNAALLARNERLLETIVAHLDGSH